MNIKSQKVLITGSAGFIGFSISQKLLLENINVLGVDNFNSYYDLNLKKQRHKILKKNKSFTEIIGNIEENKFIEKILIEYKPNYIIHLAAQAGVRYSLEKPDDYLNSNIIGTYKILNALKKTKVKHFLFASTSSVYGDTCDFPYYENSRTDFPISFYAATKKSCEIMTHTYSHLYKIPTTVFRFFTVYGPWGRPDMALFKFTKLILSNKQIDIYNNGNMKRDFTYIDDLVEAIFKLMSSIPTNKQNKEIKNDTISTVAPWRVVNIGNQKPIKLLDFIKILEKCLNKKAIYNFLSVQPGEVLNTFSNCDLLYELTNFRPNTQIEEGIKKFLDWYLTYNKIEIKL